MAGVAASLGGRQARRDGVVMVADAGSTNGMWIGDDEVRCVDVTAGATVELARFVTATWMPLD